MLRQEEKRGSPPVDRRRLDVGRQTAMSQENGLLIYSCIAAGQWSSEVADECRVDRGRCATRSLTHRSQLIVASAVLLQRGSALGLSFEKKSAKKGDSNRCMAKPERRRAASPPSASADRP